MKQPSSHKPVRQLLLAGFATNIIVPGLVLEAAVQIDSRHYLLFLTDGIIFEERLTMVLIDINHGVKEIVRIGQAWASGYFENLSVKEEEITFHFLGEAEWRVKISLTARLRFPFFADPPAVHRAPGWKKYLTIDCLK
ncbi:hypothetical protein [Kosakonia pseudosacchari]|uniref:hypothetical protein n=1 Tax=Kosakonia pseudosacchari TaxID=1646340 RepID=UPI0018812B6F|nr:hypothetical protein [Kosakonia pseudosacchari]QOV63072.1 hypothetical protein IP581_17695 [Kosakonia pseudosacchari]